MEAFAKAAFPTPLLALSTARYLLATALSLPKVLIHLSVGRSLRAADQALETGSTSVMTIVTISSAVVISVILIVLMVLAMRKLDREVFALDVGFGYLGRWLG